jgi:hypothetical protein
MRIKEIISQGNIQETVQTDMILSEADTTSILSLNEEDFSEPMTGDQLMAQVMSILGSGQK